MNNRIKQVRKYYGLSQTEFGKKIGVTIGVIRNLESGITSLSSPLLELFISTYNVNPMWLKTGDGDMLLPTLPESELVIKKLVSEYSLSDPVKETITRFLNLSHKEQDALVDIMKKIIR